MRAGRMAVIGAALALAALCMAASAASAGTSLLGSTLLTQQSGSAKSLVAKPPAFMTKKFRKQVRKSGNKGKRPPKGKQPKQDDGPGPADVCPGIDPNSPTPATTVVSAGTCEVYPYGCTANFVYYGSGQFYIGTAGHCVDRVGQHVYMQVNSPGVGASIADVGTVAKFHDNDVGDDYAVIAIAPGFDVDPAMPTGGPQGIYTGCDPTGVRHYGHGYGVAVAQGKQEGGLATNWYDDGYGWTGAGAPGDSGSGVLTFDGMAAGDFTHLIVDVFGYPGSDLAGTRITKILAGTGLSLVNADGSLSRATSTSCGPQPKD